MVVSVGTYQFAVDAYLSDFRGKATLPMIGGFMLQAATKHAEQRDFGYSSMTSRKRVWVLSRMAIEIYEYPQNETEFFIDTWVADVNKLFTERCFCFRNSDGKKIGYAKSIWASIDIDTRKPTNVLELENLSEYINTEEECPIEGMKKIPLIKEYNFKTNFTVRYSDIDINKHLNSMKYIEHFVDIFDLEIFREKEIRRIEINYINEAHYGSSIDLLKKDDDSDVFLLEMKCGDATISSSRITWG